MVLVKIIHLKFRGHGKIAKRKECEISEIVEHKEQFHS